MGKIKDGLKAIGKAIVTTAADFAECIPVVGNVVHNYREQRRQKTQEEAAELKQDFQEQNQQIRHKQEQSSDDFAESFGDESYDAESANAAEIRRMSQELNRVQQELKGNAENIENKIIEFVQDSIRDMIKEFEDINSQEIGSSKLNLNISYLTSIMDKMENQITGYIQNSVKRNLSLDSSECADILKIQGKKAKKQAMKAYQNDIFNDAVDSLWATIRDSISVQNESVFYQIKNRLDALERNAAESVRQLEEIEKVKKLGEKDLADKQSEYKNMMSISSWCSDELEKEQTA